ncbi:urea transporter DVU1160 isoform X2 [Nasonia vitripennis]|uniref:Urea transporter n=1 Tax=Nasonia vitripennis TaxID=7425 RepID=A0A7M7ILU3_NASVI|nr:urea transporter DVU1160 isoform X2 [Nasonia vitripennis]
MSSGEVQLQPPRADDEQLAENNGRWATIGGDCPALRDYLAPKEGTCWALCKLLVSFVRGFSQTGFANNPITGIILMVGLVSTAPGTFLVCSATGFLGHLISMSLQEPSVNVDNGLTVFNPLIFGAVSYYFVPVVYGGFDGFSSLLMLLGVIFIAYFWRACGNGGIPCLTMPFNVAELILLFTLKNAADSRAILSTVRNASSSSLDNAGAIAAEAGSLVVENATTHVNASPDWGMVVQASLASASQLFVTESLAFGALVYLAVLVYSPITCFFGYLGSLGASLVALLLGAPHQQIRAGLWGFNGYLTAASLGGSFLVMNGQVAAATCVAIVLTALLQHVLQIIFVPTGLPVGTMPFVLTTWLFIGLGNSSEGLFNYPITMSSPEGQRQELLTRRKTAKLEQRAEAAEPLEILLQNGKSSSA